jgi:hypothetical protein
MVMTAPAEPAEEPVSIGKAGELAESFLPAPVADTPAAVLPGRGRGVDAAAAGGGEL